jgi:hypothetical protein
MATCSQCSRKVSFWRRGVFTGLCPRCGALTHAPDFVKRWVRVSALAVLAVGVVMLLYSTPLLDRLFFDTRFSAEEWRSGDVRTRGKMARDLAHSARLDGKSPSEVRDLLGKPNAENSGGQTIRYNVDVGYRWVITPVPYDVVVRFGKDERVVQVKVETPTDN